MNAEFARRINTAAVKAWYFKGGITRQLDHEDIDLLKSVSTAQIQTAGEVVEALNRDTPSIGGKKTFACVVASESVPSLKAYIDAIPRRAEEPL